jgi:uncharacterized protein (DUF2147 family)
VPKSKLASLFLLALLASLALGAAPAAAAKLPQPVLGAWKLVGYPGGFTLKKSGNKVVMTSYHVAASCEGKNVKLTLLGSFALKSFSRGGYSTWGIGKNVAGEPEPIAVKVQAAGKTYNGSFDAIWDYEDPAREMLSSFLSIEGCSASPGTAKPK